MPLNRMVKPTSGICCEIAQKHDAEFMQNFFEKLLDKSVWQVYNELAKHGERLSAEARQAVLQQVSEEGTKWNLQKK